MWRARRLDLNANRQEFISLSLWSESTALFARIILFFVILGLTPRIIFLCERRNVAQLISKISALKKLLLFI